MKASKSSEDLNFCFNYFHVPGNDEKSLFRKGVVESVSRELQKIAVHLDTPTIYWTDKSEMTDFLHKNPLLKFVKAQMPRDFFIGEIALCCGWFLALKHFLETQNDLLVIFEDDLWFNTIENSGVNRVKQIADQLPKDTELLFLFNPEDCFSKYGPELDINEFVCEDFATWSTAFVMLTRAGAQKILAMFQDGIDMPIDAYLRKSSKLKCYAVKPNQQVDVWSIYDRTWLGSTIDPRMGQIPQILVSDKDIL